MEQDLRSPDNSQTISTLLGEIVDDAQKLVRQELALARTELQEEYVKVKGAAGQLGLAFAALGIAGLLLAFTLVHVLADVANLPLWASYLIITFLFAGAGLTLYFRGRDAAAKVSMVPKETVETLKENVQWIRNQT